MSHPAPRHAVSPAGTHAGPRAGTRALVLGLVLVGLVVSVISSLGAPLIPSIAETDGVSLATAQWSLTLALLVGAVATPVLGRLGDGPRRRPVVLGAIGAVLAGAVLAALPLGFTALLLGRGLQGIGLGLIPLTIAVARDHVPGERGRSTIALLSVTAVAGVGLGYPLTGVIAEQAGIHGAFAFGAVLSALALAAAWAVLPDDSGRPPRHLDVPGALLLGSGFAALLLALADGEVWGWTSARVLGLLALGLVLLALWVRQELRVAEPLVDLRLMRHRGVLVANVTALLSGVGMYLMMSMVIRLVQTPTSTGYGIGASIVIGGLVLLPMSLASVAASRLVPRLTRRLPLEVMLPVGTVVLGAAVALFTLERGSLLALMVVMGVTGLGVGITVSVMPALIIGSVPTSETGSATGFNQVLRTGGYTLGSALSATLLEAHTAAGQALPTDAGYQVGGYAGIALCLLTLAVVLPLLALRRTAAPVNRSDEELLRDEALADALTEEDVPLLLSGSRR